MNRSLLKYFGIQVMAGLCAAGWAGTMPSRGVCAHRGNDGVLPENTAIAFTNAVKLGAAMVELDVGFCKTGELVIMHDDTVDRTTDGHGKIRQMTFAEIRALKANYRDGKPIPGCPAVQVPTFEEMIDAVPADAPVWINCHVKDNCTPEVARIIRDKGRLHQAFVSAPLGEIARARQVVPEIKTCNMSRPGPRTREWTKEENTRYALETISNKCEFIQYIDVSMPSPEDVRRLHAAGVRISYFAAWTPARARDLAQAGIDFVLANEITETRAAFKSQPRVRRIFRPARLTRGNTNVLRLQPIDAASWLWLPGEKDDQPVFLKFRNEFEVAAGEGPLTIDVSADERYYLTCDGEFVGRGPNRSTVENWQYNTYEITLQPGRHVLEAAVWRTVGAGPLAQLSCRGGFVLKADGVFDKRLTTGVAEWQVGRLDGIEAMGKDGGAWGAGDQWKITGSGIVASEPKAWKAGEVVRSPAGREGPMMWGGRTGEWMLFPSQIADQTEDRVRPGQAVAATHKALWRNANGSDHAFTEDETHAPEVAAFNDFLSGKSKTFVIPSHTRLQLAWNLGRYICAYPEIRLGAAKGARLSWCWTEATRRPKVWIKGSEPGARDAIVGRYLEGFGDVFVPAADRAGDFTTPWFRCGKWCRLDVETADDPLVVESLALVESRYPLEMESAFATPEDETLQDIRRISARAMQMCCHEMLFDCPFYEQQMYPGDTRVQLNVLTAMSRDDRMIKRAIELFDLAARDDGQCPFNWPTRGLQEGATYTLCYLLMYGDYVMNHGDRDWLRARLPGLRKSMAGMEYYENADGLLENLPGWLFMDWVVGWRSDGTAPGGRCGEGVNAEANLFWILAMQSAALTERTLGHELQAQYWEDKAAKLKAKIVETFWCERRGLLADTPEMKDFSEHAQSLAILGNVLPKDKAETAFHHLVEDVDLSRCTVYFSYYLFETYFKMGRGDLFQKRLDLWRDYVKKGLTTTQEAPDSGKNGQKESRSDCHAWGAHPIWFMQTGLAGIRSDAPFFAKVRVAPCPGTLTRLTAKHPHPQGFVEVDLAFKDGKASGTVKTPVPGTFVYGGETRELKPGTNAL